MPDGIGDAFLNASINREVDRLAIGLGELAEVKNDLRVGMATLKPGGQFVDQFTKLDAAKRSWSQLLDQRAVHGFQPIGDRENLADALDDLVDTRRSMIRHSLDRGRVGGDAEQTWAGFVVKLVGDLAALFFL